jgi:hypothetical protein
MKQTLLAILLATHSGNLPSNQWDDAGQPALSIKVPAASAPDFEALPAGSNALYYCFPDGSDTYLYFSYQLTHRYAVGTAFNIHLHWAGDTDPDATLTARMVVDYAISDVGEDVPTSTQAHVGATIADDEETKHQTTEMVASAGTSYGISAVVTGRIWRDGDGTLGTDDYTGKVCFLGIDSHIQVDRGGGSAQETVK